MFDTGAKLGGRETILPGRGACSLEGAGFQARNRAGQVIWIVALKSRSLLADGCVVRPLSNSESRSNKLVCTGMQTVRFDD
jgi:hypothetical protein